MSHFDIMEWLYDMWNGINAIITGLIQFCLLCYLWFYNLMDKTEEIKESVLRPKNKSHSLKRCIHHYCETSDSAVTNEEFAKRLDEHAVAMHEIRECHTDRVVLGGYTDPINMGNTKVTLDIPIVFYLVDPVLNSRDERYWTDHINKYIISRLNDDYNRTSSSYRTEFLIAVNNLFGNADLNKRSHYLNLINVFPHDLNLEWKFSLKKIVIKPIPNLTLVLGQGANDNIFKSVTLEDPETNLNIIIVSGNQILGFSVFPFADRDPINTTVINPMYKFRNGVLINTKVFLGNVPPFNRFRTFTHEIGHWCGLLHPFDNNTFTSTDVIKYGLNKLTFDKTPTKPGEVNQESVGDMIADTTPQLKPTYGTVYDAFKTTRKISGNKVVTVKTRNTPYDYVFDKNNLTPNFLNFMDYTDDDQMCMFTHMQMLKMIYMLARFRPGFVKS